MTGWGPRTNRQWPQVALRAEGAAGFLHVRREGRQQGHPTDDHQPRLEQFAPRSVPMLFKEFDWTGTWDPTPCLVLPDSIQVVGGLDPVGWPGLMAANHALAMDGRARIAAALGVTPHIPAALHGSMALVPLPMPASDEAARALRAALMG